MRERMAQHLPEVYRFALRLTGDRHRAEDLTQETMLRVCATRSELRDDRSARVWLFRITANLWKDSLRRTGTKLSVIGSVTGNDGQEFTAAVPTAEHQVENREELEQALVWLNQLPPRQRSVLYLVAVEGLTLSEVSEILAIETSAARASLSIARRKMRELRSEER